MAERRRRGRPRRDEVPEQTINDTEAALLRKFRHRVERGRQHRSHWRRTYRVDELARCAYGPRNELEDSTSEEQTIWINKFEPTLKLLLPSLFFNAPTFKYDVISDDITSARRRQSDLIGSLVKRISMENRQLEIAARLAIQQATHAIGVVKIIYDPKMEPNPRKGELIFQTNDADEPIMDPETGDPMVLVDQDGEPAYMFKR